MDNRPKIMATIVIWLSTVGISFFSIGNSYALADVAVILMTIIPLLFAFISTVIIWIGSEAVRRHRFSNGEKAKHDTGGDMLSILEEMMEDDEREEFRAMLKQRALDNMQDGELPVELWENQNRSRL